MTFKEFYPHGIHSGEQAHYTFPNGYGISVINGPGTYEVGILYDRH